MTSGTKAVIGGVGGVAAGLAGLLFSKELWVLLDIPTSEFGEYSTGVMIFFVLISALLSIHLILKDHRDEIKLDYSSRGALSFVRYSSEVGLKIIISKLSTVSTKRKICGLLS